MWVKPIMLFSIQQIALGFLFKIPIFLDVICVRHLGFHCFLRKSKNNLIDGQLVQNVMIWNRRSVILVKKTREETRTILPERWNLSWNQASQLLLNYHGNMKWCGEIISTSNFQPRMNEKLHNRDYSSWEIFEIWLVHDSTLISA